MLSAEGNNSEINVLCEKYGSDKGESSEQIKPYNWFAHNYADVYELIFKLKKEVLDFKSTLTG